MFDLLAAVAVPAVRVITTANCGVLWAESVHEKEQSGKSRHLLFLALLSSNMVEWMTLRGVGK